MFIGNGGSELRLGAILVAGAVMLAGCEDESDVAGEKFRINPSRVVLTPDQPTAVLQVQGGIPPFSWRVTDDTLGAVTGEGITVTYTRKATNGANTVEVSDSRTWTATATMVQEDAPEPEPEPEALSISPSSLTLNANGDQAVLTALGGVPPYHWTVLNAVRGHLFSDPNGATVIYERDGSGDSPVQLTDSNGGLVILLIEQP